MYSHLDRIFRPYNDVGRRHAEGADTHMALQKHDPDKKGRKGKKDDTDDEDFWEDSTSVSVTALKAFLEGLVGGETAAGQSSQSLARDARAQSVDGDNGGQGEQPAARPPAKPQNTKAAKAYQRTYEAVHPEETLGPSKVKDHVGSTAATEVELSPKDRRAIHRLIDDLNSFAEHDIHHLYIHPSASFLQSLIDAAEKIKAGK